MKYYMINNAIDNVPVLIYIFENYYSKLKMIETVQCKFKKKFF